MFGRCGSLLPSVGDGVAGEVCSLERRAGAPGLILRLEAGEAGTMEGFGAGKLDSGTEKQIPGRFPNFSRTPRRPGVLGEQSGWVRSPPRPVPRWGWGSGGFGRLPGAENRGSGAKKLVFELFSIFSEAPGHFPSRNTPSGSTPTALRAFPRWAPGTHRIPPGPGWAAAGNRGSAWLRRSAPWH